MMNKITSILVVIIAFVLLGDLPNAESKELSNKYRNVSALLARVKHTDELIDTVHRNTLVLKAVGLFLEVAEANNLSEGELKTTLRTLFPLPEWKAWVPGMEIKKVKSELYLVSIGYAAVTQDSSLYLFSGPSHIMIASGRSGTIHIEKVNITDSKISVTYLRTPGSTRPDYFTALLEKKGHSWKVNRITAENPNNDNNTFQPTVSSASFHIMVCNPAVERPR